MKSVIVGTAGHIDHGKTALVKALTGIDADRLQEEKRRGITIDLGFAHMELPGPDGAALRLGFVDVPGHERFVRNMLAGVGGIDLVLFVIAADEGIKPQTREHFDICRLLNIPRGITVLTKCDLVERDTLEVVRLEVEDFLRGSFLDAACAPIIAASARTGAGIPELKQALAQVAFEARQKESAALFRLPVDRVFVMKGFGTVVTGTLVAGSIGKDEEVEVHPLGRRVRVRGVEVHGQPAERARAGERTALNLAGMAKEDLARGMTLAPPGLLRSTERADVSLTLLAGARPLRDRSRVHLHAYSAETVAEVLLYDDRQLSPGATAYAQMRLADAMLLLPGDRFIVRQFSPVVTIGGGAVLDASPPQRKQDYTPGFLSILATGDGAGAFKARVARRGHNGLSLAEAIAETGWTRETVENLAAPQVQARRMLRVGDVFVHGPALEALHSVLVDMVKDFHRKNPLVPGMSKEQLREGLHLRPEILDAALATLAAGHKVEVLGEQVRLPGRGAELSDEETAARRTIEQAFLTAGLKVPALKEVLAALPVDKTRAQKIVTLLLRDKVLVKLADDLVFHSDALAELRRRIAEYKSTSPNIDVARFKDLAGVSRKYAIPLLEYLDRERVTRRVGNERVIL